MKKRLLKSRTIHKGRTWRRQWRRATPMSRRYERRRSGLERLLEVCIRALLWGSARHEEF